MTIRIVRVFLWVAVAFVIAGTLAGLAAVAQGAFTGRAAATSLPLRIEPAQANRVVDRQSGAPVGELTLDRATLNVRSGGAGYAGVQALDITLTGGLWLLILLTTIKLVAQFARAEHFNAKAVHRLRLIGWSNDSAQRLDVGTDARIAAIALVDDQHSGRALSNPAIHLPGSGRREKRPRRRKPWLRPPCCW